MHPKEPQSKLPREPPQPFPRPTATCCSPSALQSHALPLCHGCPTGGGQTLGFPALEPGNGVSQLATDGVHGSATLTQRHHGPHSPADPACGPTTHPPPPQLARSPARPQKPCTASPPGPLGCFPTHSLARLLACQPAEALAAHWRRGGGETSRGEKAHQTFRRASRAAPVLHRCIPCCLPPLFPPPSPPLPLPVSFPLFLSQAVPSPIRFPPFLPSLAPCCPSDFLPSVLAHPLAHSLARSLAHSLAHSLAPSFSLPLVAQPKGGGRACLEG